ncbi:MAG: D-aminoacyl-tRNA deacylase [Synergistota bacterium]|jgi:D-tyrosyl-tRNA(Tyr) deacylase|nr:D-aminoacyl-tRNA deacylase [Synergistota bacterium]OPZ39647.1 MAG: D-tyrosyl-tRNA(Tyr) deacylase [Synergistetes bacterium ADurb.BinA166]
MRAVIQRVGSARVLVDGEVRGEVGAGLCVLLAVADADTEGDADWMADKLVNLRIFADDDGKMNRSLVDIGGAMLAVSQFTLYGDCRRGRRPSFAGAGDPAHADRLFEEFKAAVKKRGVRVESGVFGAHMLVCIENDGPVTLVVDR